MERPFDMLRSLATTVLCLSLLYPGINANLSERQGLSSPTDLPENWSYKGCYTDSVGQRSLSSATFAGDNQSAQSCIAFCTDAGYSVAGTEYSRECFCGNSTSAPGGPAPNGDGCNMACTGAAGEACGGPDRLSIYVRTSAAPPQSSAIVIDAGDDWVWTARGCYSDLTYARILSQGVNVQGGGQNNSAQSCTTECGRQNFKYSGLEYGAECYCGNTLNNGQVPKDDGCNMRCNGDKTQFCGGPDRINIFEYVVKVKPTPTSTSTSSSTSTPSPTPTPDPSSSFASSSFASSSVATSSSTDYHTSISSSSDLHVSGSSSVDGVSSSSATPEKDATSSSYFDHSTSSVPTTPSAYSSSSSTPTATLGDYTSTSVSVYHSSSVSGDSYGPSATSTVSSDISSTQSSTATTTATWSSIAQNGLFLSESHSSSASSGYLSSSVSSDYQSSSISSDLQISTASSDASSSASSQYASSTSISSVYSTSTVSSSGVLISTTSASVTSSQEGRSTGSMPTVSSDLSSVTVALEVLSTSISINGTTTSSSSQSSTLLSTSSITPTPTPEPKTGWQYEGCYIDGTGGRSLPQGGAVQGQMTNDKCRNACRAQGLILAGTEYYGECYCGSVLVAGGAPAPDGEALCNTPCDGNKTEMCGGPNRLSLFRFYFGNEPLVSSTTVASSSVAPVATGLPAGFEYKGCYVDGPGYRVMQNQQPDDAQMTVASCSNKCAKLGYDVAGMEYSTQCFCDKQLRLGAYLASNDAECNTGCGGNSAQKCGGGDRLSIWSSQSPLKITKKPVPTQKVGNWTYQGCITDYGNDWGKPLPWKMSNSTGNSPSWCLDRCAKYGYMAAGMEYGEECYCGDLAGLVNSETALETDCTTPCPGDPEAICGQGNRLSWYKYTAGEPLYVFDYPQGDAAGRYEFLVGGPVIPLVSQPLITGKVSFLEKHGTGPNGTGAYELDPSIGNDIFHAFREMNGLKTDVFCSASITMPDRAGRVINIGGWSADSLFGVRMYWPDGSAGVNGTNDWQENLNEVSLQTTRWYPTSMVMANGSLLVVGGENGSNGPPVPNMEILPRAGGLKFAQYLLDTDPYNLYPFLMVLPSGGIMIQYYNEARILDERTLDPIKILPKIPATVNDDSGGRTYPLEGTQVLLPQVFPYTEPLEVLICGGAGRAPAWGIDNCVTTQPDLPNPEWTIERMPSRRVMSCMVTLPDGTFLILNGAEEGAAGFGLADKSNFNAVLYDTRKPKHHRMSIMANTTIARMYHSEAVLMDDGRILVSGSDPEDDKHPQEYRVEVFLPPYLTQGKARPSFTIETKDWINEQQYSFQVTGSGPGIKVSLLGSEASTHGNSMGARVLFPQINCDAWPTCTVTAPGGPYVAPPGWYRMFVLDNDVPSHATWVRIGGDPGRLGEWPNTASFQPLPGVGPVKDLHASQKAVSKTGGQKFRA